MTAATGGLCLNAGRIKKGGSMVILGLLLGAFFPRLLFVILWISTNLVDRAFTSFLVPLLGVIFLPFTSLFYVLAYNPLAGGLTGAAWLWVLIGFMIDLSTYTFGGYRSSHRAQTA
jgi:hypothetical protein